MSDDVQKVEVRRVPREDPPEPTLLDDLREQLGRRRAHNVEVMLRRIARQRATRR